MAHFDEQDRLEQMSMELRRLQEWSNDLINSVDMADAMTFDAEDGTLSAGTAFTYSIAYSMGLTRPGVTACAYITEQQLRMIRARSRAFATMNPYWMAVRENRINYCIGTGHVWMVSPRRPGKRVPEELSEKVSDELELFSKINRYRRRQAEKITRLDRDGEFFLRSFEDNEDGVLRVRFVEPLLVQDPPGMGPAQDVWFGIQFTPGDYEDPLRYYIRSTDYLGGMTAAQDAAWQAGVPADEIQHRTANVDIGSPRGLPSTYALQETLTQALSTLKSMGKLVDIRARIAIIRKQVNATLGQITPLLHRNRAGRGNDGTGTLRNVFRYPYGSVIDSNDQRTFEFPSQHIETDKIVHALKSDLQAAAAAMGLADFCISGDSASSFSNALVKEGPMDRAMCRLQQDLIDDDVEVYERALMVAAKAGRLPVDVLKTVRLDILPPQIITRNRIQDTQADEILVRNGAMSPDTMSMRANLDPEDERTKAEANPSPQVVAALQPSAGDTRSNQAPKSGKTTARGVPGGSEPGPSVNPQRAEESAHEPQSTSPVTQEDRDMATAILTPEWLQQTKNDLLGLPQSAGPPRDAGVRSEYEPGVPGIYLGVVDGQACWAVDMPAWMMAHDTPAMDACANSARWPCVLRDRIIVNWSLPVVECLATILHEIVEQRLMEAGWSYSRAHRYACRGPGMERDFLLTIRPDLAA